MMPPRPRKDMDSMTRDEFDALCNADRYSCLYWKAREFWESPAGKKAIKTSKEGAIVEREILKETEKELKDDELSKGSEEREKMCE